MIFKKMLVSLSHYSKSLKSLIRKIRKIRFLKNQRFFGLYLKEIQTSDFEKLEQVLVKHFEKHEHLEHPSETAGNNGETDKFKLGDDF